VLTEYDKALELIEELKVALEAAEDAANEIQREEYGKRKATEYERLMELPDVWFYSDERHVDTRPFVLPFGRGFAKFNPMSDEDRLNHAFGPEWTANSTAIICKKEERQGPTRLIWSSGLDTRGDSDKIGRRFIARHDQTGAILGQYKIVGLAFFGPDGKLCRTVGDVPSQKFAQSTYK